LELEFGWSRREIETEVNISAEMRVYEIVWMRRARCKPVEKREGEEGEEGTNL
jgi:hypothetical protein